MAQHREERRPQKGLPELTPQRDDWLNQLGEDLRSAVWTGSSPPYAPEGLGPSGWEAPRQWWLLASLSALGSWGYF